MEQPAPGLLPLREGDRARQANRQASRMAQRRRQEGTDCHPAAVDCHRAEFARSAACRAAAGAAQFPPLNLAASSPSWTSKARFCRDSQASHSGVAAPHLPTSRKVAGRVHPDRRSDPIGRPSSERLARHFARRRKQRAACQPRSRRGQFRPVGRIRWACRSRRETRPGSDSRLRHCGCHLRQGSRRQPAASSRTRWSCC